MKHLSFDSSQIKEEVYQKGQKLFQQGLIAQEKIDLGQKYQKQIQSGFLEELEPKFVSDKVGYGLFSKNKIPKGSYIGEYTGVVRENIRIYFAPLNDYCYAYPVEDRLGRNFVIDATDGNLCRYINHRTKANLIPKYAFVKGFFHVIFVSSCDIDVGEELFYDYGQSYWTLRSLPEEG